MYDSNNTSDGESGGQQSTTSHDAGGCVVQPNDNTTRFCKICYETDAMSDDWLHPCRCSGTIKWVHRKCLIYWLENAPFRQRAQCTMCMYYYRKCWNMKPLNRWTIPSFRLGLWDGLEIVLDLMMTYRCVRHVSALIQGTSRSIFRSLAYIIFWRLFILNDRRVEFYRRLGGSMIGSILETTIQDAI